ncbi:MAG: AbrB/MazE/SpoVT family DNA-binding domain-containing protein [Dongiaceae bacterium]
MSITLKVTAKGQVTLRKEVLDHLGIGPGDQLEIEMLPAGRLQLRARPGRPVSTLFGRLKKPRGPSLSLAEIAKAAADGWAGRR